MIMADDASGSEQIRFGVVGNTRMKIDTNSRISLSNNDSSGAVGTTLFGYNAGLNIVSGAIQNTFIGHEVSDATMTNGADYNTAVGASSMSALTSGTQNTAYGMNSLHRVTSGNYNTAIGVASLEDITTTSNNTAVGRQSGFYSVGSDNTYIGYQSGLGSDSSGADSDNTAVGSLSLTAITTGNENVAVGSNSGDVITSGTKNTCIGAGTDPNTNGGTNQTVIGYGTVGQGDNTVTLGDANVTHVCLGHEGATAVAKAAGFVFPAGTSHYSADANTLDDYEEGTWTPNDQSGGSLSFASASGNYTKIGNLVTAWGFITYPSTSDSNNIVIGTLPFTSANVDANSGCSVTRNTTEIDFIMEVVKNTTTLRVTNNNSGAQFGNANFSGDTIQFCATYKV